MRNVLVTGGSGFIGAYLVRRLISDGYAVSVLDNLSRGSASRLAGVKDHFDFINIDIRDEEAVTQKLKGIDTVFHLAAINGTENFYNHPDLVLDVGVRGMMSIVNACLKNNIGDLVVASTAEVYQSASIIPTPEDIPLMLPNSLNPRYSYGASKIISEVIAFNYGKDAFNKVQVFRPHNIYGPDMGWKHVIPQFITRAAAMREGESFKIHGTGNETRAFCHVDDAVEGILTMYHSGATREIYHVGNDEEITISNLAMQILSLCSTVTTIENEAGHEGGTPRRCPSIEKLRALGYEPRVSLHRGLKDTVEWYLENKSPAAEGLI